jgi:hypothetical protein
MPPEVSDHEAGDAVDPVALEIDLMPVYDKDAAIGPGVLEDQGLIGGQSTLLDSPVLESLDIMVAKDHVETIVPGERVQQIKRALMGLPHRTEASILPQLITITDFNVGETLAVVVRQSLEEEILIPREGIRARVVTPV